jgi:hypothetical protein
MSIHSLCIILSQNNKLTRFKGEAEMLSLSFFIFCGLFACMLFGCSKIRGCDSGMRMLNAEWLAQEERFKLISRWGIKL